MRLRPGDRIRLVAMGDDPCPIEPGTEGVVRRIAEGIFSDGSSQIAVDWDVERSLRLVVPPDRYEVVERAPEPQAGPQPLEGGTT